MNVREFITTLDSNFFTGVPDSQLRALCDYLMDEYGIDPNHHLIAANEGNSVGLAAGYYLSTGKVPVVYMQNSGEGNIVNPIASLMNDEVYGIPCIFIVGWRGEPGIHDEPQHIFQGRITVPLLEMMGISNMIIDLGTSISDIRKQMKDWKPLLDSGKQVAFVVRKNALEYDRKPIYKNRYLLNRETVLKHIVKVVFKDPIVSTTGKISRELFEIREAEGQGHQFDFMTVGSMGHCSSIALAIAVNKPDSKIWCIDGDGAVLMHMGSMAVIGSVSPKNLVHIVLNNAAHDTVGGMPTVIGGVNLTSLALACGYKNVWAVDSLENLDNIMVECRKCEGLTLVEVRCALGSRSDLGRPTTTAKENKEKFMGYLSEL